MKTELLDLAALAAAPLQRDPFPYAIVSGFLKHEHIEAIEADYPKLELPGSFPLSTVSYGAKFQQLMRELEGDDFRQAVEIKLGIDLSSRPTMTTVRGQCRESDGKIHTDSRSKLVTVLIYMNGQWESPGGRLRLLRNAENLEDYVAEVPPGRGTLLLFHNTENAWHGHHSFQGPRRVIQLNWVRDDGIVWREQMRHKLSAFMKKLRQPKA